MLSYVDFCRALQDFLQKKESSPKPSLWLHLYRVSLFRFGFFLSLCFLLLQILSLLPLLSFLCFVFIQISLVLFSFFLFGTFSSFLQQPWSSVIFSFSVVLALHLLVDLTLLCITTCSISLQ